MGSDSIDFNFQWSLTPLISWMANSMESDPIDYWMANSMESDPIDYPLIQ